MLLQQVVLLDSFRIRLLMVVTGNATVADGILTGASVTASRLVEVRISKRLLMIYVYYGDVTATNSNRTIV
jgi:hypothetical protein